MNEAGSQTQDQRRLEAGESTWRPWEDPRSSLPDWLRRTAEHMEKLADDLRTEVEDGVDG